MGTLSTERIERLLKPFVADNAHFEASLGEWVPKFSLYLDLLLKWNARTNLTAVREPEDIVRRHFGEGVFAASVLQDQVQEGTTLLDYGSGAGFPGLPIQICLPKLLVCLGESQHKKCAFLREAIRTLGLNSEVWAGRVEDMPPARSFNVVTLRAVDKMEEAVSAARKRVTAGGTLALLSGENSETPADWKLSSRRQIPDSERRFLTLLTR